MAGKISVEMTEAKRLIIECGLTAYEAAQKAGVRRSGIYMAQWYKDYMARVKAGTATPSVTYPNMPRALPWGATECQRDATPADTATK